MCGYEIEKCIEQWILYLNRNCNIIYYLKKDTNFTKVIIIVINTCYIEKIIVKFYILSLIC